MQKRQNEEESRKILQNQKINSKATKTQQTKVPNVNPELAARLEAQHAPKNREKVDEMFKPHETAQKTYNKLGKFVPPNTDKKFEGLPVLGPYKCKQYDNDYTYLGQFKEGKRHGFGTEVRL